MPILAAAGHPVLAPDLRGLGDSEKIAEKSATAAYGKRTVAEDVLQLTDLLGYETFHLVGHDIGAWAAFALALARPVRVRKLVLAESLLPGFGLEERMDVSRNGYWHFGFHMAEGIPEMLTAGREHEYLSSMAYRAKPRPSAMTDADIAEYVRCYAAPGGMRAAFGHYRAALDDGKHNKELAARIAPLPMPVLVLGGQHSAIPRDELVKGIRKTASDVRDGGAIQDSGHFLSEDNPAELSRRLLTFFDEKR
jgi:pimeloyl-ACP methyl ester carboxylesterase